MKANLLVIDGPDCGKRFDLAQKYYGIGRDVSNSIRLLDTEVSRMHAELREFNEAHQLIDLGSVNGMFINGQRREQAALKEGDQIRFGQTLLIYSNSAQPSSQGKPVQMVTDAERPSVIHSTLSQDEGTKLLSQSDGSGSVWLRGAVASIATLHRTIQLISRTQDIDELLEQVMDIVFDQIQAERGFVLLRESDEGELIPKAVRRRGKDEKNDRISVSRTIVNAVLERGEGMRTTDAMKDERFSNVASVIEQRIRSAMCVPIRGPHQTFGVLYVDTTDSMSELVQRDGLSGFDQDQLSLLMAIGHLAAVAIEALRFYREKVQAERMAAMGETIANISHHVKNVLQGIRGGGYLVESGLKSEDLDLIRRGWTIVDRNQTKIYNLVMDMLTFSKEREPAYEPAQLNDVVQEVVDLMRAWAEELGIQLVVDLAPDLPKTALDPEGIHRAVLNILNNALDAVDGQDNPIVRIRTQRHTRTGTLVISVRDNGIGIPEGERSHIFEVFNSSKGGKGTGLGLAVAEKIIREHNGSITVISRVGLGTKFRIHLPRQTVKRGPTKARSALTQVSNSTTDD